MLDWLSMTLSGSTEHHLPGWVQWHARLMVLAWGVLLPLGALVARYFKVTRHQQWPQQVDNRAWWHAHQALQYSGVLAMAVGVALAYNQSQATSGVAGWHRTLGWWVVVLGLLQVVGAWLRGSKGGPTEPTLRGDHYDMTMHRRIFEWAHKKGGWLAVGLSLVVIGSGLWVADAPRWMPLVLVVWWLLLATWAMRLQRAGRCIDTYQAIWGPDPVHPGNQPQGKALGKGQS